MVVCKKKKIQPSRHVARRVEKFFIVGGSHGWNLSSADDSAFATTSFSYIVCAFLAPLPRRPFLLHQLSANRSACVFAGMGKNTAFFFTLFILHDVEPRNFCHVSEFRHVIRVLVDMWSGGGGAVREHNTFSSRTCVISAIEEKTHSCAYFLLAILNLHSGEE